MPDYPPAIIRKAADAIERELASGPRYPTDEAQDEALARAALDAVAADLGQHVAEKILAHMEAHGPVTEGAEWTRRYRRDFGTAARVAAFAFLTEDDKLRMAAAALAAGDYVACFDGATDERSTRLKLPRSPIAGRKMNPADVVSPAPEDSDDG